MPFVIHRISGPAGGEERATTRVEGDLLRIGRGTNADLRFDDAAVALEHATLARTESGWMVADGGSVTGTYVGGKPVSEWRLADGDAIDVGSHRLRVTIAGPQAPLEIEVRARQVEAGAARAAAEPPRIDYAAAYRLRHGLLSKPWLALAATALAAAVPLALAVAGRTQAFQPGAVTPAHADQPRIVQLGCGACHTPWRGTADERCQACHRPGGSGGPALVHQTRQTAAPGCDGCHVEHRGTGALLAVADGRCVACHGDLAIRGGGAPAFATHVHAFATDHPELSVTVAAGAATRRIPLAAAIAAGADPARLKFGHRLHLRPGLRRLPAGKSRLLCADCHALQDAGTGIRPVAYSSACASCHPLTFDARQPGAEAPHGTPEQVRQFLDSHYAERRDLSLSVVEQRRTILRHRLAPERQLDVSATATRRVAVAEHYLYTQVCAECHDVDPDAAPLPIVAPTAIPAVWLPHARFPHQRHRSADCRACHAGADESARTADVLLPGIAACRVCHGGGGTLAGAEPSAGPTRCVSCHGYHGGAPGATAAR